MTIRTLTNEEYAVLKQKLHHAHDNLIKVALHEDEAARELIGKIIAPLLPNVMIDLDNLTLDNTTYIRPNLRVFFSDVVYLTYLIDALNQTKEPAKVAILIEHKSDMPTQLQLRLQASEYINAIMKKNYNKKTDTTIPVIGVIFNQFDKNWEPKPFRSLFPKVSPHVSRLIPEYDLLYINLAGLPDAIIDSLNQYGTLKAALLAMKHIRNMRFLKLHFEEIFLFLQEHPEKIDLKDQLIAYLLGQSKISAQDLEDMLANIFSPILKEEIMIAQESFMAVAAKDEKAKGDKALKKVKLKLEAEKKARIESEKARVESENTLRLKTCLVVMKGWHRGMDIETIVDMAGLPLAEVKDMMATFDKVKNEYQTKTTVDFKELMQISGLNEEELKILLDLVK